MSEPKEIGPSILVWQHRPQALIAFRCYHCDGSGRLSFDKPLDTGCNFCGGYGWYGILPWLETNLHGSEKVSVLQARYTAGMPLWNSRDDSEMYEAGKA